MNFQPNLSIAQTTPPVAVILPEEQEVPPPKDYLDIGQKSFEILFQETSDFHEITFDIDTYLSFANDELKIALDNWYRQKFMLITRTFNELQGTAIQPDQILPKMLESYCEFEGNSVTLFNEIAENIGYSIRDDLYNNVFNYSPFLRFINVTVTTKKGEFVQSSRTLDVLYKACVERKIEISKDKIKDQYPKLFENKTYKNFTQKDAQPIEVISIAGQKINLFEGLRLIKTSLFIDVYDSAELAEIATFRSFVSRLTNLLKRNIAVLKHKHAENAKVISCYQYLRKIDGGKTLLDEMVKEVYRQSIATQVTIEDLNKPEVKIVKTLEKYIEKEKSIAENVFKLYDQIILSAQALKALGSFRGDVQKTSYVGLLKNLLYYKTGNLFKKPTSMQITQAEQTLQFLNEILNQITLLNSNSQNIDNAIFKANQLKRIVDNHINNSSLNSFFHLRNESKESFENFYKLEIFKCLNLKESEINKKLDLVRDEFTAIVKDFKDVGKKA